jgi:hypothetical protein
VPSALEMLEREFAASVADRATAREALAEFDRMVYGSRGMGLLLANRTAVSDYGCRHGTTAPELTTIEYQPPAAPAAVATTTDWAPTVTAPVVASAEPTAEERAKATELKWQVDVWNEQYKLKVRDEATRRHRRELRAHRAAIEDDVVHDLDAIPEPEMLLGSLIPERSVGFLAGRSGAYKTFLAVSWACCIATGYPWLGRPEFRVARPLRTLYIAAEGAAGAAGRVRAWEAANSVSRHLKLAVYPKPIHLNDEDRAEELAEYVAAKEIQFIVVDTYHRAAPGTEENSATDFGKVFEAVARLRDEYGCGVLFVDHTGHDGNGRPRGTSAKGDDADYVLSATYEGLSRAPEVPRMLTVLKLKDEESSGEWTIKLADVEEQRFPVVVIGQPKSLEAGADCLDQLAWPLPGDVQTLQPKSAKDGRPRGGSGIAPLAMWMRHHAPEAAGATGRSRAEAGKELAAMGVKLSEAVLRNAWSALAEAQRIVSPKGEGHDVGIGRALWRHIEGDPAALPERD